MDSSLNSKRTGLELQPEFEIKCPGPFSFVGSGVPPHPVRLAHHERCGVVYTLTLSSSKGRPKPVEGHERTVGNGCRCTRSHVSSRRAQDKLLAYPERWGKETSAHLELKVYPERSRREGCPHSLFPVILVLDTGIQSWRLACCATRLYIR